MIKVLSKITSAALTILISQLELSAHLLCFTDGPQLGRLGANVANGRANAEMPVLPEGHSWHVAMHVFMRRAACQAPLMEASA